MDYDAQAESIYLKTLVRAVASFGTFDIISDGDGMSDEYLTEDEWRVKVVFDLGGVEQIAPNKFMIGSEDVTNQVISIILKRRYANIWTTRVDLGVAMGKSLANIQPNGMLVKVEDVVRIPDKPPGLLERFREWWYRLGLLVHGDTE